MNCESILGDQGPNIAHANDFTSFIDEDADCSPMFSEPFTTPTDTVVRSADAGVFKTHRRTISVGNGTMMGSPPHLFAISSMGDWAMAVCRSMDSKTVVASKAIVVATG